MHWHAFLWVERQALVFKIVAITFRERSSLAMNQINGGKLRGVKSIPKFTPRKLIKTNTVKDKKVGREANWLFSHDFFSCDFDVFRFDGTSSRVRGKIQGFLSDFNADFL